MNCRDMEEVIITSALAPGAAEHIAGCERCRHLVWVFDESRQTLPPSPDQMKRIEAAILRSLTPVQPLASPHAFFSAFALVFLAVVAMGSLLLGTDGWRALSMFQRIAVFSPLAACAGLLAVSLVRLMATGSKHVISPWDSRLPTPSSRQARLLSRQRPRPSSQETEWRHAAGVSRIGLPPEPHWTSQFSGT